VRLDRRAVDERQERGVRLDDVDLSARYSPSMTDQQPPPGPGTRSEFGQPVEETTELQRQQQQQAIQWISTNWTKSKSCPICGNVSWTVGHVLEVRPFNNGGIALSQQGIFPVFPVTCTTCGYTMFFNALRAGVLNLGTQPESPSPEAGG
jgi:predicted nucleic-acid-binding Zn-ribbon protein